MIEKFFYEVISNTSYVIRKDMLYALRFTDYNYILLPAERSSTNSDSYTFP